MMNGITRIRLGLLMAQATEEVIDRRFTTNHLGQKTYDEHCR
jgi:hypothetical protein